jgi:hypothetical protein
VTERRISKWRRDGERVTKDFLRRLAEEVKRLRPSYEVVSLRRACKKNSLIRSRTFGRVRRRIWTALGKC